MQRKSKIIIAVIIVIAALVAAGVVYAVSVSTNDSDQSNKQSTKDTSQESASTDSTEANSDTKAVAYFVALEDGGQAGPTVGCGDSLVAVDVDAQGEGNVQAAFEELLSNRERLVGQSGLYNALSESDLQFDHWMMQSGVAMIHLSGELKSGGACDDARIIGQLDQTALISSGAENVKVLVNGTEVKDILSAK